jgi:acyl carrier protein
MEEKLKQFIGDQLGISPNELTPESDLTEDLGVGPVEIADLLTNIEAKFGVKIPDEERAKIKTIGQLMTKLNE